MYGEQTANEPTIPQNDNDIYMHDIDLDKKFTEMEVIMAIMSQTNGKSSGTDLLIPEAFKSSSDILLPFLTNLYTNIFNTGIYPQSWTKGIIVPIFNGGKHEAEHFRGITLNNSISKIYSKLLVTRLVKWSEKSNTIIDNQIGVQKNKSTIDCSFILHALITKTLSTKKIVNAAFLDLEKCLIKLTDYFYGENH